jgi:hypothetical protein
MLKKWVVKTAIALGTLLVVICVAGLTAWTLSGFGPAVSKANKEYAAWKTNGLPDTRDKVFLTPPPAPDDNAAAEMAQAADLFKATKRAGFKPEHTSAEGFKNGALAAFLKTQEPTLKAVEGAVDKKAISFDRDWDLGASVMFPEFADMKHFAKGFAFRAHLKAQAGDWRGAVADIHRARPLDQLSAQDATLIAALVGIAIDAIALDAAGICASSFADNSAALKALRKALEDTRWEVDMDQTIRGEAYMALSTFRNLSDREIMALASGTFNDAAFWGSTPAKQNLVRDGLPPSLLAKAVVSETMAYWNEF